MKTPREILLARHRAVEPKLDAVRQRVVANLDSGPRAKLSAADGFIASLREFFRLPRFAWGGLAAAWLVIIALNLAARDTTTPAAAVPQQVAKTSPETLQALREQKRLFAELVGSATAGDADAPRFVPRPRSERKPEMIYV